MWLDFIDMLSPSSVLIPMSRTMIRLTVQLELSNCSLTLSVSLSVFLWLVSSKIETLNATSWLFVLWTTAHTHTPPPTRIARKDEPNTKFVIVTFDMEILKSVSIWLRSNGTRVQANAKSMSVCLILRRLMIIMAEIFWDYKIIMWCMNPYENIAPFD